MNLFMVMGTHFLIDIAIDFVIRHIPVDMAAFAVNIKLLMKRPEVKMGYINQTVRSRHGFMESDFLQALGVNRRGVECRGSISEVSCTIKLKFAKGWLPCTYNLLKNESV